MYVMGIPKYQNLWWGPRSPDHNVNVYRPPKTGVNRVITAFKAEFEKLVTLLSKCPPPCAVTGDFNLNLLKLNERPVISDFF